MSKLSRRTLVATAAVLPALVVPAGAALASDEDPELLALGVEFEKAAVDWVRQRQSDRANSDEWDARVETASGIPRDQAPKIVAPAFWEDHPDKAAIAYSRVWIQISDELYRGPNGEDLGAMRWSAIHDRMWPLANRIMQDRPKTVAGLGIVARAASFVCEEWFDDEHPDPDQDRSIIEAMCAFCGVIPLPAEV
jgi:hypothetical protein